MSLYAAYFVPGGVDPRGLEKVEYDVGPSRAAVYGPTMWELFWRAIDGAADSTYYRLTVGTQTTACGGGYRLATSKCGCKYDIVVKKRFVDRVDDAYAPTWGPNDECKMLKWLVNEARVSVGVICPGSGHPDEPVQCLKHLPEDVSDWALRSRNDWAPDQFAHSARQGVEAVATWNSVGYGASAAGVTTFRPWRPTSAPTKASRWSVKVKTRTTPGRDGATARHLIERVDGKVNSVTHQVIRDGKIIHQHQTHVGKYGTRRQFPDEWVQYPRMGE